MAIPAEHLYVSCTCIGGMRDGARCADCGGRGIVPKGTKPTGATIPEAELVRDDEGDDLENQSINHLRSRAKDLGVSAGGSKDALIARIREATADAGDATDEEETEADAEA